jgi:hypothetical protein
MLLHHPNALCSVVCSGCDPSVKAYIGRGPRDLTVCKECEMSRDDHSVTEYAGELYLQTYSLMCQSVIITGSNSSCFLRGNFLDCLTIIIH